MANASELPNPFTPLAFLPPSLATQLEVSRYIYAVTLGAYVWDIGLNGGSEYALLFKHRIHWPTIVYFLSRIFTLAFILATFVFEVAPVPNCSAIVLAWSICSVLSQSTTAMLFFLRVTAVWHPSKIAYTVFFILWLAVLAGGITAPIGVRAGHIGPTMQCITTDVPGYVEVAAIMPLVNDTAIFFAITYRILANKMAGDSRAARMRVFFGGGTGLSTLSQALLHSGQHFYLVAVVANVALLVAVKLPQLPPLYHAMLTVPCLTLINVMACQVFRKIKFGLISSDGRSRVSTTGRSSDFPATPNSRSLPHHYNRADPTSTEFGLTTFPLDVRVQREIDKFEDGADTRLEISKTTALA
ncbi:hypothetical protein C8R45DRAFT_599735 [Mycena sanguinolenta]|nr:hypothetical protein C8R45DRAFT_599735 [Mycena sanguinolenta]